MLGNINSNNCHFHLCRYQLSIIWMYWRRQHRHLDNRNKCPRYRHCHSFHNAFRSYLRRNRCLPLQALSLIPHHLYKSKMNQLSRFSRSKAESISISAPNAISRSRERQIWMRIKKCIQIMRSFALGVIRNLHGMAIWSSISAFILVRDHLHADFAPNDSVKNTVCTIMSEFILARSHSNARIVQCHLRQSVTWLFMNVRILDALRTNANDAKRNTHQSPVWMLIWRSFIRLDYNKYATVYILNLI